MPETVVLELEVGPDPLAGHGRPARDGSYRTKLLLRRALRDLGLRCRKAMDGGRVLIVTRPEDEVTTPTPNGEASQ